ncbi:MAG: CoA pyrophosphatase, partial [Phycisphaeraceae bacterium]|nr:CoA pyrophosphatase [Phycisphaeraceae bacterium]
PWSGHMAFPGGREDPGDANLEHTAKRETHEEVGFPLDDAHLLGRLDDLSGRAAAANRMVVSAYVFHASSPDELLLEEKEVADAIWVPLTHLTHPENLVHYPMQYGEHEIMFPGIGMGPGDPRVVWGLTYRFLEIFFEIIGHPLPEHGLSDPEDQTPGS